MGTYLYRCTEQQLEQHLQRVAEAGDTVEHVIFKGGRDYVLVCRPAPVASEPVLRLDDETISRLSSAMVEAFEKARYKRDRLMARVGR